MGRAVGLISGFGCTEQRKPGASECVLAPRMRVPTRMAPWDSDGAVGLGWGAPWGVRGGTPGDVYTRHPAEAARECAPEGR